MWVVHERDKEDIEVADKNAALLTMVALKNQRELNFDDESPVVRDHGHHYELVLAGEGITLAIAHEKL